MTLIINDSQHNALYTIMLIVIMMSVMKFMYCYAECYYVECRYAECRGGIKCTKMFSMTYP